MMTINRFDEQSILHTYTNLVPRINIIIKKDSVPLLQVVYFYSLNEDFLEVRVRAIGH